VFCRAYNRNYGFLKKAGFSGEAPSKSCFYTSSRTIIFFIQPEKNACGIVSNGRKRRHRIQSISPGVFYPSRIISRKNPVEAILLSQFFFSSNLLLGESGMSSEDRALAARLKRLWRQI